MKILSSTQRRALRARGHGLSPLVRIASRGLSASVLAEIDRCLAAHELLKIRLFDADRETRDAMLEEICAAVDAAPVQHIGKLLLIWREKPAAAVAAAPQAVRGRGAPRLTKKAQAEVSARPLPRKIVATKRT